MKEDRIEFYDEDGSKVNETKLFPKILNDTWNFTKFSDNKKYISVINAEVGGYTGKIVSSGILKLYDIKGNLLWSMDNINIDIAIPSSNGMYVVGLGGDPEAREGAVILYSNNKTVPIKTSNISWYVSFSNDGSLMSFLLFNYRDNNYVADIVTYDGRGNISWEIKNILSGKNILGSEVLFEDSQIIIQHANGIDNINLTFDGER